MEPKGPHTFVVLEGISGSGKTEISKRLADQMQAQYYATPPGMFRKMRQEADRTLNLDSRFLFYLSSVIQASWEIEQILATQSVICDKYIWSTICYHRVYGLDVDMPPLAKYLQPDHVFLMYCEEPKRLQRLQSRGPIKDMEKYNLRQEMERRCLAEFRRHIPTTIDNSSDNPQIAADKILDAIKRG